MAYINNKFCWHGIITSDVEAAKTFYSKTIGWGMAEMQMGGDTVTVVTAADIPRAHLSLPPMEGVPPHISSYLRVEDVDAATKAAVANGGQVLVPPTDIPPGRFSCVTSPSGAAIMPFHEADESTAQNPPPGLGSIHWVELHSTDVDADLTWLKATFGLAVETMPMPDGKYYLLLDGKTQVGGMMKGPNPDAPSYWLVWVHVDDVDACLGRIKDAGGQGLMEPWDMPGVGRMVAAMGPDGAAFGVITPAG